MDAAGPMPLDALLGALAGGVAVALVLLPWALQWRARARRAQAQALADTAHWQQVFDTLDIGLMVFDAEDRLLRWNADYERLYPAMAGELHPGMRFEDLLRAAVDRGMVPGAPTPPDAWIAERVAQHRQPREPILRQMANGRWRRITERYLADGGMVSYSIDVTALVEQGEALKRTQRDAQAARQRLQEALDVLPAGIEWFDAEDRLVLANQRSRQMFPLIGPLLDEHPTFEQLVRANHAAGGLPGLATDIDSWIHRRLAERRSGQAEHLLQVDGRWIRVHERRTHDGGTVSVRLDVTTELSEREAAEHARRQLHDAIEALPDGFALYDADDRLVLCNERYRTIYRESAPALHPGAHFADVLRFGLEHGQYPQALGIEEAWLAERLQSHREPGPPVLQELPGNRWLRIDERRTRDGGVAGVRADVTALVRREQVLDKLNRELDRANARLADLLGQDPETGVANDVALQRALTAEWARSRRHGSPLTLLSMTVDPAAEDAGRDDALDAPAALRALAQRLAGCARRPGDLVARTGPRRFALLLPHTGWAALDVLVQHCATECRSTAAGWSVQVSAAASDEPPAPGSVDELRARAEQAPPPAVAGRLRA
ncbi:MAG: PAS-domain containing protein [Burkholderiaceae bacterium]|nr:PAS-domain containing protein [Burkholderiaceae bacterium]